MRSSYQERRVGDQVIKREGLEIKLSREKGWRSSYQERRVGDPVIKREGLEIQLSREKGWRSSYQEESVEIQLSRGEC